MIFNKPTDVLAYFIACERANINPFSDKELIEQENEIFKRAENIGWVEFVSMADGGQWVLTGKGMDAAIYAGLL